MKTITRFSPKSQNSRNAFFQLTDVIRSLPLSGQHAHQPWIDHLTLHAGTCRPCARSKRECRFFFSLKRAVVLINYTTFLTWLIMINKLFICWTSTAGLSHRLLLCCWRDTLSLHVSKCVTWIISVLLCLLCLLPSLPPPCVCSVMCLAADSRIFSRLMVFFSKPAVTAGWAVLLWGEESKGSRITH